MVDWFLLFLRNKPFFKGRSLYQHLNKPTVKPRVSTSKIPGQSHLKEKTGILCYLTYQGDTYESIKKENFFKLLKLKFQFCCCYCTKHLRRFHWVTNRKPTVFKPGRCSSEERPVTAYTDYIDLCFKNFNNRKM